MLLVGSRALKIAGEQYLNPDAKRSWDYDFITTYEEFLIAKKSIKNITRCYPSNKGRTIIIHSKVAIYEFEIAWPGSTAEELLEICKNDCTITTQWFNSVIFPHIDIFVAQPNLIFTLKKSHRFLKNSPHFLKTMLDFRHLRSMGCDVPETLTEWYKKREKETYNYKLPKLYDATSGKSVSKDEFFAGDDFYVFEHDSIHLAMMHLDKPAYNFFKEDSSEVKCSMKLFAALDHKIKMYAVLEESYTLALERSQIPYPKKWSPRKSFEFALMKISSSISSGKFREFCHEHYFEALEMYDDTYVDRFWKAVDAGIVKKLDKKTNEQT